MSYVVMVDDNYHYMDPEERYKDSEHATAEAAVARCKAIVDRCLVETLNGSKEMTANELITSYKSFGDDPFILHASVDAPVKFSAWDYAVQRAAELCGGR